MSKKKVNTELQQGIHNPPDQLFLKFGNITLYSDSLFITPIVHTTSVMTTKTHKIIWEWMKNEKIDIENYKELSSIINQFVDYMYITEEERITLFKKYKETQLAKLNQAIKGLNKLYKAGEKFIYNDKIRLPNIYFNIECNINRYSEIQRILINRKPGYHQLLYEMLLPLLDKLQDYGYPMNAAITMSEDLLIEFDYDYPNMVRELKKYIKKPYCSKNIIKKIQTIK